MESTALPLYRDTHVWWQVNLTWFLEWCRQEATREEFEEVISKVTLVHHRRPPWKQFEWALIRINEPRFEHSGWLWEEECNRDGCLECAKSSGRYTFDWIGPWSCHCIMGDGVMTKEDIIRRYYNCSCRPNDRECALDREILRMILPPHGA